MIDGLLFAAAWLGHAYALTVVLNLFYSRHLPRQLLKAGRWVVAAIVFGFPAWVYWEFGPRMPDPFGPSPGKPIAWAYLTTCQWIGGGVVPAVTLARRARRPPACVRERSSRVIDVAARLGRPPIGRGKHRWLARVPGNQLYQVEFTRLTLRLPSLPPALDGLTVLHLTDLHFHGTPDRSFFDAVIRELASADVPDLVCLTGDVVDSVKHHWWIPRLLGGLPWSAAGLAILGNHDRQYDPDGVRRQLRRAGWHVVGNAWTELTVRGEPVVVVGDERPWFQPGPDLTAAPAGPWRLVLAHTPDRFAWAQRQGAGLVLAGHVHGGQVRVPLMGSLFVPSWYSRRYDAGVFASGSTVMVVGRGLSGREPLRLGCRPEVIRLTLRAEALPPPVQFSQTG